MLGLLWVRFCINFFMVGDGRNVAVCLIITPAIKVKYGIKMLFYYVTGSCENK